jgi:hypothetical protein
MKFHVAHGLKEEMKRLYNLPKFWDEKLDFDQVKGNVLRNQLVYFGLGGVCFWLFNSESWSAPGAGTLEVRNPGGEVNKILLICNSMIKPI